MGRLNMRLYGIEPLNLRPADTLRLAELRALPWPYGELYAKAVTDAPPGRAHWEEGVDFARAQQLELWPGLEGLDRRLLRTNGEVPWSCKQPGNE
jgi:hypothetical protein